MAEGMAEVDLWTVWEYHGATQDTNLKDVLNYLEQNMHKGKLEFKDVFHN